MKFTSISAAKVLCLALATLTSVHAHSWIDDLTIIGGPNNGTKGFIRNFQGHIDALASYRITDPTFNVPACAPFQQQFNNNPNPQFPQLTAAPGDIIQGSYTENGHITKLEAPHAQPGTIYWYASSENGLQPTLAEVKQWTADGRGGNGKGMLIAGPRSFDDGVCAENSQQPLAIQRNAAGKGGPCKTNFKLPDTLQVGSTVTVYWVWDYDLHFGPEMVGHIEWYTSCADIKISGHNVSGNNGTGYQGVNSNKPHRYNRRYASRL
ncbi:hypothetical protein BDD12DRAFT_980301 [Trichophaea hybrida]|nr:hypothetical protein BDD12DRAFT_980301 [Trichophaea hybrida]